MADVPACHTWPVPETLPVSLSKRARILVMLEWWQRGRCAVCGRAIYLEIDHDHASDAVRGYLCRRCNSYEGKTKWGHRVPAGMPALFDAYRARSPAAALGLRGRMGEWTGDLDDWPDGCARPRWGMERRQAAERAAARGATTTTPAGNPVAAAEYLCAREERIRHATPS